MRERIHPQELLKKQGRLLIVFGVILALSGTYDIFYRGRVESGLTGLILAIFFPLAIYRGYFLGVGLLMFGSLLVLSQPLLGLPMFIFGIAYVLIKEVEKWLSTKG